VSDINKISSNFNSFDFKTISNFNTNNSENTHPAVETIDVLELGKGPIRVENYDTVVSENNINDIEVIDITSEHNNEINIVLNDLDNTMQELNANKTELQKRMSELKGQINRNNTLQYRTRGLSTGNYDNKNKELNLKIKNLEKQISEIDNNINILTPIIERVKLEKILGVGIFEKVSTAISDNNGKSAKEILDLYNSKITSLQEEKNKLQERFNLIATWPGMNFRDERNEIKTKIQELNVKLDEFKPFETYLYQLKQLSKIESYQYIFESEEYKKFVENYNCDNQNKFDYSLLKECNYNIDDYIRLLYLQNGPVGDDAYIVDKLALVEYIMQQENLSIDDVRARYPVAVLEAAHNYKYMSEEQRNMYHYLFNTKGEEEANKYLEAIKDSINKAEGADRANQFISQLDLNDEGQLEEKLKNLGLVTGKGVGDGITQFIDGLEHLTKVGDTYTANDYEKMIILQYLQENSTYLDGVYQFSTSFGNMIIPMTTSAIVSFLATPAAGAKVASGLMGLSAAGNTWHQSQINGNDLSVSALHAIIVGCSETTLGYFLGKIPGISETSGFTLKNLLCEAGEEYLQPWIEAISSSVVLGENVDWNSVPEEAKSSAVMGFLMAGFLNGGQSVINTTINGVKYVINVPETLQYIKDNPGINIVDAFVQVNGITTLKFKSAITNYKTVDINYNNGQVVTIRNIGSEIINGQTIYMFKANLHDGNPETIFYSEIDVVSEYMSSNKTVQSELQNDFLSPRRLKQKSITESGYLGYFAVDNITSSVSKYAKKDFGKIINNSIDTKFDLFFSKYRDLKGKNYGASQSAALDLKRITISRLFENKHEFERLKNKLTNDYGFSNRDATIVLKQLDSTGACSYASVVNEIFAQFMDDPVSFKNVFGYDMFTILDDGSNTLNSAELLVDLYTFANHVNMGGKLFDYKNGQWFISDFKYFINLNTSNQQYLSGGYGKNATLINSFLQWKNSELLYTSNVLINRTSIINNTNFAELTDLEILKIKKQIQEEFKKGNTVSLGIYRTKKGKTKNYIVMHNQDGGWNVSTKTWSQGDGHSVFVTGVFSNGITVSSWGNKYFIEFEDLKRNPFIFTSSEIVYNDI